MPEEKFGKQIHAKSAALFVTDPHPESWSSKSANIKMPSMLGKEKQVDDQIDIISEMNMKRALVLFKV